ncbi:MAG: Gfo/Idh/MocA family oxidoreductase [Chloroflexota bacterium]
MARDYGVALIGTGFMGGIHARGHNLVRQIFPDSAGFPVLKVVADVTEQDASAAAFRYSIPRWTTRWQDVLDDPEIEVVDICAPPFMHKRIAIAAAEVGKHIYCEKPVGRGTDEPADILAAVRKAGVKTAVGLNYRWCPALLYAKELLDAKRLGDIRIVRVLFFGDQDHLFEDRQWRWRMSAEHAGWGALADIGSHAFDMARHLVGDLTEICGRTAIDVRERPDPSQPGGGLREVDNDDTFAALVTFANGATGVIEGSRTAVGSLARFEVEITGSEGFLRWDFRRMNELELFVYGEDRREAGITRIQTGPHHNIQGNFTPSTGHNIGYTEMKTVEIKSFFDALARGENTCPNLDDYVAVSKYLEAVTKGGWVKV